VANSPGGKILKSKHAWFDDLVATTSRRLARYVGGFLACPDDVQEIVQEAYLKVFVHLRRTGPDDHNPAALLYTTARNLAISRLRHERVLVRTAAAVTVSEELRSSIRTPEHEASASLKHRSLVQAVNGLPPKCRSVLVLRMVDGLSHRDIGERLGITISTVEKHLAAGLRLCREQLGACAHEPESSSAKAPVERTGT